VQNEELASHDEYLQKHFILADPGILSYFSIFEGLSMQVVLVMFRSDGERRSFSVVRNMTVIGRREDCDLRIPVGDVSRKHCRLVRTDDGIRIEDLGSSNGTFVNGQRIQESELNAGDQVGVGPVQFIVQINGVPEDDQITQPVAAFDPDDTGVRMPAPPAYAAAEAEEFPLEEAPLEEVPLEEAPVEEFALEEVPLEELEEAPPIARRPPVPPPPPPLPAMPEPEMAIEEELEPAADALHLGAAPAAKGDSEIEHVEMEGTVAEHEHAAPAEPAAEGDWDFVVDEPEAGHTGDDFHIDLDSPQEQPHN
jgi:predicted component of type VI protein secretion system